MRKCLQHPALVGALAVGIVINLILMILGLLGFSLMDALFVAGLLVVMCATVTMQIFIHPADRTQH